MKVRFTRRASAEYDAVLASAGAVSASAARRVNDRIAACLDLIAAVPSSGRATNNPRLCRLVASPFPYLIFYEIRGGEIVVVGIGHGARAPHTMPGGGLD